MDIRKLERCCEKFSLGVALTFLIFLLDKGCLTTDEARFIILVNMDQDKLRKKLSKFLKERDMTLYTASFYFRLTTATLSKFINNKTNLNDRSKYKIEKGLGVVK
jgi:hypothetical protein